MAIIAGARTIHQVHATWRAGFMPVMKVSWISSPLCLAFAQQFLPQETWVPFFNLVSFFIGTYINSETKKKRIAALRRQYERTGGRPEGRPKGDQKGDQKIIPGQEWVAWADQRWVLLASAAQTHLTEWCCLIDASDPDAGYFCRSGGNDKWAW